MTVSWALSDQERAALHLPRPGHVCAFGMWFRADPRLDKISNRFQRRCKCGRVQFGRGTQWGLNIQPENLDLNVIKIYDDLAATKSAAPRGNGKKQSTR